MKAFDFFCGAGGLTRGLLDAGIKVVAGFDRDERCRATYEHNNPGVWFIQADIRNMTLKDLGIKGKLRTYDDVLFAGCAPCQPFSSQNKGNGRRHDATLLSEFGRLVESALPGYVLIENVPGIAKVRGYSTFRRFLTMLETNGYQYSYGILDAKRYGVPQNRRRLVLLAARQNQVSLPEPKYGRGLRPFRTVRQAISHFPEIGAGECHSDVPNHVAASITELNLERLGQTPHDGGDRRSWPKRRRLECHKGNYEGHTDVYGRMAWDSPSPALTGRCHSISNGRYGHPEQDRAISLREAAAIQSFPDGYEFFGSNKHVAMQIGNAVPVRLAEHIGKHIFDLCGNGQQSRATGRRQSGTRKRKR
jgi:DNA (cytosine-5)-methyltransferase 1